jgi:hypothetical protein
MTPTDLNEAPYPPEIKARGWGFDIDVERIEASETWALAGPELRPWLLMTWITAWRSQPVGTMPAAPRVFAARIGMPWVPFQDAAEVLMRGWVQHADGLLYHPVITERVLAMSEKRLKDSVRVATWRARNAQPRYTLQTGDTDVTDTDATRDQHVSTTPLPLPIPIEDKERGEAALPHLACTIEKTVSKKKPVPDCPHEDIIRLWGEKLPTAIQPRTWTGARADALKARWREDTVRQNLEWWAGFFEHLEKSDFLMGRTSSRDRGPFLVKLDWLCEAKNFAKALDGQYDNTEPQTVSFLQGCL